jgi:hypothetical protein
MSKVGFDEPEYRRRLTAIARLMPTPVLAERVRGVRYPAPSSPDGPACRWAPGLVAGAPADRLTEDA